jgi:hypothetical protein
MQTCGKTLQTTLLKQNHTTRKQMFTYLQLMIAKEKPRTRNMDVSYPANLIGTFICGMLRLEHT